MATDKVWLRRGHAVVSLQVGLLSADLRCDLLRFARPPRTLRSAYIPPQGAKASQARCRGFEPRLPLHFLPFRPRHNVAACHGAGVAVRDAPGTSQGRTGGLAAAWRATHQSSHREPVNGMARREREPVLKAGPCRTGACGAPSKELVVARAALQPKRAAGRLQSGAGHPSASGVGFSRRSPGTSRTCLARRVLAPGTGRSTCPPSRP